MLVKSITEEEIYGIGHAFGYYDYGEEIGMSAAFSGEEAAANYICAYVRGVLRGGFLHTTSEIPPASGARAISPISCRRRRWSSRPCGPSPAECCTTPP